MLHFRNTSLNTGHTYRIFTAVLVADIVPNCMERKLHCRWILEWMPSGHLSVHAF